VNLKPLADRIVVEPIEGDEKTAGGIILPDNAKEKPQQGKVLATGKGRLAKNGEIMPLSVKVEDRVLFPSYCGTEVKIGGKKYLIMSESDILAIIQ